MMKNQKMSKTKIAFLILLLHLAYVAIFCSLTFFAILLDGNLFLELIMGYMLLLSPFVGTTINISSIIIQIWALCKRESKVKNILMMLIAILHEALMWWLLLTAWEGAMSV